MVAISPSNNGAANFASPPTNQTALTMMLLGMINWTFTWLRPGGPISYAAFAEEVIAMLEKGLG